LTPGGDPDNYAFQSALRLYSVDADVEPDDWRDDP
jgi:hypothetical protein